MQLAEAGEQGALHHAAGDFLRLADDEAGEGDAGHDNKEERQHGDERRRELRARALGEQTVQRLEDDVEDGDADQARRERRQRYDERGAEDQDHQGGAVVFGVEHRHGVT